MPDNISQQEAEEFFLIMYIKHGRDMIYEDYVDLRVELFGPSYRSVPVGHPMRVIEYYRWCDNKVEKENDHD